eukprot:CAMPEP_0183716920 /NCGR_PEP_ID=MMETSP0737-20130205/10662_1 /TAXON_ID=385413 /ORGANISM="Thalassiosira miniscula, Strain CCMP1093" /LENGTH=161 /DNA_ID=CAMNT_0025946251 /DNA_START=156 /DNA_END=637 /DNA_ORIENTATION=+
MPSDPAIMADENDTSSGANNRLSRRAAKKARRKQEKAEKKRKALDEYLSNATNGSNVPIKDESTSSNTASVGGKAARARLARQHDNNTVASLQDATSNGNEWQQHRPAGGAPILSQILPQHLEIVECLEMKEQEMRIKGRGIRMKERMAVEVDCHGSMDTA